MSQNNIIDLNTFINTQITGHDNLSELFQHIHHLIDFTANSDLANPDPLQLNAQFIAIEKSIQEAEAVHQTLQQGICWLEENLLSAAKSTPKNA